MNCELDRIFKVSSFYLIKREEKEEESAYFDKKTRKGRNLSYIFPL